MDHYLKRSYGPMSLKQEPCFPPLPVFEFIYVVTLTRISLVLLVLQDSFSGDTGAFGFVHVPPQSFPAVHNIHMREPQTWSFRRFARVVRF